MTTEQIKKLTEALEQIADYDAAAESGYVDEWQEAHAFLRCREIARDALNVSVGSGETPQP